MKIQTTNFEHGPPNHVPFDNAVKHFDQVHVAGFVRNRIQALFLHPVSHETSYFIREFARCLVVSSETSLAT